MTNLVDMLRALIPPRVECSTCGVALRYLNAAWRDGAGGDMCQANTVHVSRSPLLREYR